MKFIELHLDEKPVLINIEKIEVIMGPIPDSDRPVTIWANTGEDGLEVEESYEEIIMLLEAAESFSGLIQRL